MNTTGKVSVSEFLDTGVFELDQKYFPRPWKQADWESLNPLHHKLYLRLHEKNLVGFALFGFIPGDGTAHLLKISILPSLRGSGEIDHFWSFLVEDLKSLGVENIYLEVEEHNLRAVGFYKKMGFQQLRIIKNFYSDGINAQIMNLTL